MLDSAYLNQRVVQIVLLVDILQILRKDDLVLFPASAEDIGCDVDLATSFHRDAYVAIRADASRCAGRCERLGTVRRDLPSRRLGRRVCYNLEHAGNKPILQDGSVCFCRGYVDGEQMWFSVGQQRYERCQV